MAGRRSDARACLNGAQHIHRRAQRRKADRQLARLESARRQREQRWPRAREAEAFRRETLGSKPRLLKPGKGPPRGAPEAVDQFALHEWFLVTKSVRGAQCEVT